MNVDGVRIDLSKLPSYAPERKDYGFSLELDEEGNLKAGRRLTEADGGAFMLHLTEEDLRRDGEERLKNYSVTANYGLNRVENSISLVAGIKIRYASGYLDIRSSSVGAVPPRAAGFDDPAARAADGLNTLIRWANGDYTLERNEGVLLTSHQLNENTRYVLEALRSAGLDTSKAFKINGAAFSVDENGLIKKIK